MTIKELALQAIQAIRQQHKWYTAFNRRQALQEFENFVNTPTHSDSTILLKAKELHERINQSWWFGFRGRQGSTFLTHMNKFLETGNQEQQRIEREEALRKQEEERIASQRRAIKHMDIKELFAPVREGAHEAALHLNCVRKNLEKEIDEELSHHYPNSTAAHAWRVKKSNTWNLGYEPSFTQLDHEHYTKTWKVENLTILGLFGKYEKLVNNPFYKDFYKQERTRENDKETRHTCSIDRKESTVAHKESLIPTTTIK